MNIERAKELRSHMQWLLDNCRAHNFRMDKWLWHPRVAWGVSRINDLHSWMRCDSATECATAGCIAGTAALLWNAPPGIRVDTFARDALGLTGSEATWLFFAGWKSRAPTTSKQSRLPRRFTSWAA